MSRIAIALLALAFFSPCPVQAGDELDGPALVKSLQRHLEKKVRRP